MAEGVKLGPIIVDDEHIFKAAAAITANGNSTAKSDGPLGLVKVRIVISAVSGSSPTIDFVMQQSDDNFSSDTEALGAWTQITDATGPDSDGLGEYEMIFKITKAYHRIAWTVGGSTPSFTTAIYGTTVEK